MGSKHSFWNVAGVADGAEIDVDPAIPRNAADESADGNLGGDNRAVNACSASGDQRALSGLSELIGILGEANRVANRSAQLFGRFRERTGLTGVEVLTLIGITHADVPPTVPQVGRSLGHPRQVIQRAVRTLEANGFVQLLPNPGHKRASLLAPTEAGLALGSAIDAETAAIVAELAESFDSGMLASTNSAMRVVRDGMDHYMAAQRDPGD